MDSLKPDIVTIWPRNMDYPLYRLWLERNSSFYNKAIIAFTGRAEKDIDESVMLLCDPYKFEFVGGERDDEKREDWRNAAVNNALDVSESEWVWFLEPDFFMGKDMPALLEDRMLEYDCIGFFEANRLHPACLLISRNLIERTRKDFSVDHARGLDHFGVFTEEIAKLTSPLLLDTLFCQWYHMQGITHNYSLLRQGQRIGFKPDEFYLYNQKCIQLQPKQCIPFLMLMEDIDRNRQETDNDEVTQLINLIDQI